MYLEKGEPAVVGRKIAYGRQHAQRVCKMPWKQKFWELLSFNHRGCNVNDMKEDKYMVPINFTEIHAAKPLKGSSNSWI